MAVINIYPEYEVVRNDARCIACRVCERQCANEVHTYDAERNLMLSDESKCVNCHRCVSLCPTRALKIVKTDHTFKENANWSGRAIREIYRQAGSGGVLLSSMGNPGAAPDLLGPDSDQRLAGDQSAYRPAQRTYGNARVFG